MKKLYKLSEICRRNHNGNKQSEVTYYLDSLNVQRLLKMGCINVTLVGS